VLTRGRQLKELMWIDRRKTKYGNKRVSSAGYSFASKGERDCFVMLKILEAAGEIKILQTQARVHLIADIHYLADFKIFDHKLNEEVWVEYKGFETEVWLLKKKLWKVVGPGRLRIFKGSGLRITQSEKDIIPSGLRARELQE
jgi:hypothetical protein